MRACVCVLCVCVQAISMYCISIVLTCRQDLCLTGVPLSSKTVSPTLDNLLPAVEGGDKESCLRCLRLGGVCTTGELGSENELLTVLELWMLEESDPTPFCRTIWPALVSSCRLLKEGSPTLFTDPLASVGRGMPLPVVIRLSTGCFIGNIASVAATGTDEERSLPGVVPSLADDCVSVSSDGTLEGAAVVYSKAG